MTEKPDSSVGNTGLPSGNPKSAADKARENGKLGGRPRGSKSKSTLDREAYLRSLVTDPQAAAAFGSLTPMDIVKLYMWKCIELGRMADAMEAATRLLPYAHGRIGVVQPDRSDEQKRILDEIENDPAPHLLNKGSLSGDDEE